MSDDLVSSDTTPLTPPRSDDDRVSWLRLYRSRGVGVHTFYRLIGEHGDAATVLAHLPDLAARAGVTDYAAASVQAVEREMRAARKAGARLVCRGEAAYPALLATIDDPPPLLWVRGDTGLFARPAVAMVGARNASALGERTARHLSEGIGALGHVLVSGLARGIDAAAHEAALATGTIAVLGGGVDVSYPSENAKLQGRIAERGLLVSEQPMGLAPQARHFPRRNRIIAGIARALVVVEAAARSGSLITARNAAEQGREVLVVPGHPFDGRAAGCNMLIRDGATLVRGKGDIAEALGIDAQANATPDTSPPETARNRPKARAPARRTASETPAPQATATTPAAAAHRAILERLGPTPTPEDHLCRATGLPPAALAPALLDLEFDGRICRHPGGLVSRA